MNEGKETDPDFEELLRTLPPGSMKPVLDYLLAVASKLYERAEMDRLRDAFDVEMAKVIETAELRRIAGGPHMERDRAIMKKVRAGWTNARIARHMGLSESTVKRRMAAVRRALRELRDPSLRTANLDLYSPRGPRKPWPPPRP